MNNTAGVPKEECEQQALFNWAKMREGKYPELRLMFHIPNGGKRSITEATRFKAEGVKAGVPDIFLPVPRGGYHGLFIELKRTRGAHVSDNQKQWIEDLRQQGYLAVVCRGWVSASECIMLYMEGGLRR